MPKATPAEAALAPGYRTAYTLNTGNIKKMPSRRSAEIRLTAITGPVSARDRECSLSAKMVDQLRWCRFERTAKTQRAKSRRRDQNACRLALCAFATMYTLRQK